MMAFVKSWWQSLGVESPKRIEAFRGAIQSLSWNAQNAMASLDALYAAVETLVETEIRYYHRRRSGMFYISAVCRWVAWICGSIGLLIPLIAAAKAAPAGGSSSYGYVFLAIAASFLALNSLFGGTRGHVRFFSAQQNLERLSTTSRIDWCDYELRRTDTTESRAEGFALIKAFTQHLYEISGAETEEWGQAVLKELASYYQRLEQKP